jgi:hypothetical protein
MIAASEQGSARWRAQRSGVKVAVSQAACGEHIKGWGLDVAAVTAELRKAHIVEQHHHDVG